MVFDPLDKIAMKVIEEDLRMALPDNSAIFCFADLKYLELNITETWKLDFPFSYR